jgi:hypothetical protein
MAASNDEVTDNMNNFKQALDALTNTDKLAKCIIDLRAAKTNPCDNPSAVLQLLVITLIHKNKNYDA